MKQDPRAYTQTHTTLSSPSPPSHHGEMAVTPWCGWTLVLVRSRRPTHPHRNTKEKEARAVSDLPASHRQDPIENGTGVEDKIIQGVGKNQGEEWEQKGEGCGNSGRWW
jgi:hypothetical protein